MPWLEVNNQRLFYTEHQKEQSGPPLILLHGAGSSHLVWPGELRRLPGTRVLALDLPGHGRSGQPGRRLVAHYAGAVSDFIRALALPSPVLLGHSMGGAIALEFARTYSSVAGLIILGAAGKMPVSPALLTGCLEDISRTADYIVRHSFAAPLPELQTKGRAEILSTGAVTTFGDFLACSRFDLSERLANIIAPSLILGGTSDRMVPARLVESLAQGLPDSRLVWLEAAGHFMMLERPDEIASLVTTFLDELRPSKTAAAGN